LTGNPAPFFPVSPSPMNWFTSSDICCGELEHEWGS
jgi:hypothetical protein